MLFTAQVILPWSCAYDHSIESWGIESRTKPRGEYLCKGLFLSGYLQLNRMERKSFLKNTLSNSTRPSSAQAASRDGEQDSLGQSSEGWLIAFCRMAKAG